MEEEFVETECSLDEKKEESEKQKEQNLPHSIDSNSLTLKLFDYPPFLPKKEKCYVDECYDPLDFFEKSLFDELDGCYAYGHIASII